MRGSGSRICAAAAVAIGLVAVAWTISTAAGAAVGAGPLVPGDRIGAMTLAAQGRDAGNAVSIFDFCDPLLSAPALYHRHCSVPRTRSLFIGYGDFEATLPALQRVWRRERWSLHVDGREVRLAAFGTEDRTLYSYPPGSYRNSILREWRVMLVNPTPGRHLIRYVTLDRRAVTDVTFTVTVGRR